jgi:hypothetical protein
MVNGQRLTEAEVHILYIKYSFRFVSITSSYPPGRYRNENSLHLHHQIRMFITSSLKPTLITNYTSTTNNKQ